MTFTRREPPRHVVVRDAYTDVWVLRGGEWLLVNAQHTAVRAFLQRRQPSTRVLRDATSSAPRVAGSSLRIVANDFPRDRVYTTHK